LTFAITCDLTGRTGRVSCGCPPDHDAASAGVHHDACGMTDLHAIPGCVADCCDQHGTDGHDHDPAECLVEHPPGSCPDPASCKVWKNLRSHVEDPSGMPAECPGGHHGYGVKDCVPCHPLTITFLPDQPVILQLADR